MARLISRPALRPAATGAPHGHAAGLRTRGPAEFVLKNGETFAMLDGRGEICPLSHPDSGIFHRGTRHVSRLELRL